MSSDINKIKLHINDENYYSTCINVSHKKRTRINVQYPIEVTSVKKGEVCLSFIQY